ncbi:unnamed protein product [Penicillium nalgiovense]|uniref:Uncharacterized protein n=1 Tax=Penicillium nalgiovense TaxID=60175 RepID=A0A9W4HC52_PENNA|nr:unnamed protein product [Penicillium nalgiovense]CAG7970238.1 unnamed protein product [Penicillium nalgiovense]CAG7988789.1 unnamed protein product [Penicillium nalgiovense]CAG7991916.1 unnamed protein product [Penicillium nalgiovense]CAG8027241.1 unnamed protein product [Penicillium nalgiovense]
MPPKRAEASNGPQTPRKAAECTGNTPNTPATNHGVHAELLEYADPAETGWCIHCFKITVRDWNENEWVRPFKINCVRDAASKRCQRCCHAHDKCELLYEGIRGHGFELHALLEWVMEFWINEESEFGETDDASLVHDIEIVHAAAVAVRDLCAGLDCLIKSHGNAHDLAGERGGGAGFRQIKLKLPTLSTVLFGVVSCKFRLRLVPVAMVLGTQSASNSSIVLANTFVLISILTLVCLGI